MSALICGRIPEKRRSFFGAAQKNSILESLQYLLVTLITLSVPVHGLF